MEKKELKRLDREEKRKEKLRIRSEKQIQKKVIQATKPGECHKYIIVEFSRGLLEKLEGSKMVSKMLMLNMQYRASDFSIPNSVTFYRQEPITGELKGESELIVIIPVEDLVTKVYCQIYEEGSYYSLIKVCKRWKRESGKASLTLALCGVEDYFQKQKTKKRQKFSKSLPSKGEKRKKNNVGGIHENDDNEFLRQVSRTDVESALVEVQIEEDVKARLCQNPSKVADLVGQIAKAVSERPHKLDKSSEFSWHAESSNSNCVKVDKSGAGLLRLWQQQLVQFANVGTETAQAITKIYPSPQSLIQAYRIRSTQDAIKLLADIPVRRGVGVLANTRKVGIEFSKRVHLFFTQSDPDVLL